MTANLAPIRGGILIFCDPIGSGALEFTARLLAFCLVVAGAALMPPRYAHAPLRASGETQEVPGCDDRPRRLPVGMEANVMIQTWSPIQEEHLKRVAAASAGAGGQ